MQSKKQKTVKQTIILFGSILLLTGCLDTNNMSPPGNMQSVKDSRVEVVPWWQINGIKFSLKDGGIEASYSISKITFLGTFGLTFSKKLFEEKPRPHFAETGRFEKSSLYENYKFDKLSVRDRSDIRELIVKNSDLVVAIIKDRDSVDIFLIPEGLELEVVTEGLTTNRIRDSTYNPVFDIYEERVAISRTIDEDIFKEVSDIKDIPLLKEKYGELTLWDSIKIDSIIKEVLRNDSIKKKKTFIPY